MDNLPKYIVDLNEHTKKTLETVERVANSQVVQDAFKQASKAFEAIGTATIDMAQTAIALTSGIVGIIQQYDFKPLFEGLRQYILPLQYVALLQRLKWPLFFIEDESFRDAIMDSCSKEDDYDAVKGIVYSYCDEQFIDCIKNEWKNNTCIRQGRFPILSEALVLHNQGAYYGSTSTLMCQFLGICDDIVTLSRDKGLVLSDEEKDLLAEHFQLDRKKLDSSEKGKLLQTIFFTEDGFMLWHAIAKYLRDEILLSSKATVIVSDQPLRNKICHGSQFSFGTKEHSLKAILVIDILMQLAIAIEGISVADDPEE